MSNIKISVVLPLYNKSDTIIRCLESVFNQVRRADEIIIVNDGSTDESIDLIRHKYPNNNSIKIVNQHNQGVSAARNNGVKEACSEYVSFLDCDDEWDENHLLEIEKLIVKYPKSNMYSTYIEYVGRTVNPPSFLGELQFIKYFTIDNHIVHSSSVCIKKELFSEVDGFPLGATRGEDLTLWLKLGNLGPLAFCNKIMVTIHNDAEVATSTSYPTQLPNHLVHFVLGTEKLSDELTFLLAKSALANSLGYSFFVDSKLSFKYMRLSMKLPKKYFFLIVLSLLSPVCVKRKISKIKRSIS